MYCSEPPSVYSDLWNNQKRRDENEGTLQTHSIHQSAFILGLPFLVSSEFHNERHLPCVCSFFFFAQQHLTISWSWHRLQCYRDFVVPNVQKMQMSNTYGTKWTEGTSASSLFPLLMSILESLGFLTELTPESLAPLPLLISWFSTRLYTHVCKCFYFVFQSFDLLKWFRPQLFWYVVNLWFG